MKDNQAPKAIYLKDYQAPNYFIKTTHLTFDLSPDKTLVNSELTLERNEQAEEGAPLVLAGAQLTLLAIEMDGVALTERDYSVSGESLTLHPEAQPIPRSFTLLMTTQINPKENTSLEGLYLSKGMFCTQCEAEGFRKITYYLDRPDVMSIFTTTVRADKEAYPILLSNGNLVDQGELDDGRHWATWHDPFKKPCYLFALVAGDLACSSDQFTTLSGRTVDIKLYVEPHDLDKCAHAIDSLKRSMRWDEEVYGREYDLDIYMIVAVSHFNMGAMENKGLNVFNTACVLANPVTTTDDRFERVEAVIAHEYFHNWSGNRVTCRDWFQLSLKEGFTVFRDQEFSADMGSRAVKRVDDVRLLRTVQFAEDAGPMAHPVRPPSYIEINNFYTVTIYEKGAEVVRMIHTLLGAEGFRKGSDLYFERHDGQAVTTDDFVQAMADANGYDFTQFKRWYEQAGTPELEVRDEYDEKAQSYTLHFRQSCPETPKQAQKEPFHIPVKLGLMTQEGDELTEHAGVVSITEAEQSVTFSNVPSRPIPSLLRGFSAPVRLKYPFSNQQLKRLMQHDSDAFNRWEASNQLALGELFRLLALYQRGEPLVLGEALLDAVRTLLEDQASDPAALALMLTLPTEAYLAEEMAVIDVDGLHAVRQFVRASIGQACRDQLMAVYRRNLTPGDYQPDAKSIAKRSLKGVALAYLATLDNGDDKRDAEVVSLCEQQYRQANNMTDQLSALRIAVHAGWSLGGELLAEFYQQFHDEALVVDQWFSVQATSPLPTCLDHVTTLLQHEAFELTNPNKVRSLIGAFCANPAQFHQQGGAGYAFLADHIIKLNAINPQIAARLVAPLSRWRRHNEQRQGLMQAQLQRILAEPDLSPDVYEIASKSLGAE